MDAHICESSFIESAQGNNRSEAALPVFSFLDKGTFSEIFMAVRRGKKKKDCLKIGYLVFKVLQLFGINLTILFLSFDGNEISKSKTF